ncbi:hypothetical protein GmHk_19G054543 [Glycine max]|uniref:Uncharacterized protein n=1 Tax=Glycine max TaxID=3847 RepID=A0A0R0EJ58_SOYBN|nr:hypothetical protein GYH30_052350 [Glycine max]KAH1193512.1 hypothetical protein GmHk_19G054543 [Glycine max]
MEFDLSLDLRDSRWGWVVEAKIYGLLESKTTSLLTKLWWCHGMMNFFVNLYRQFVKENPPWQRHKAQWRIYMTKFWPSTLLCSR